MKISIDREHHKIIFDKFCCKELHGLEKFGGVSFFEGPSFISAANRPHPETMGVQSFKMKYCPFCGEMFEVNYLSMKKSYGIQKETPSEGDRQESTYNVVNEFNTHDEAISHLEMSGYVFIRDRFTSYYVESLYKQLYKYTVIELLDGKPATSM